VLLKISGGANAWLSPSCGSDAVLEKAIAFVISLPEKNWAFLTREQGRNKVRWRLGQEASLAYPSEPD